MSSAAYLILAAIVVSGGYFLIHTLNEAIDDTIDHVAHGDWPHVPVIRTPFHQPSTNQSGEQDHGC